jgi:uncharacterized protein YaaR (DUF327 family)
LARRSEIFSAENVSQLIANNRFLMLFQKESWAEYLELLALIYEAIEEKGSRVEHSEISQIVDRFFHYFYRQKRLAVPDQKNAMVFSMFISELGVLRDSHDSSGVRYIEGTRDGKQLLHICERLIQNRTNYTGVGADALLGALNQLLTNARAMTRDEAIQKHRETIQRYKEDMKRIEEQGVQASELLNAGLSQEELFQQADEEASKILAAGEDVKIAIESARKELIKKYHDRQFSAGKAIEFIADFHEELRLRPEYQSFSRAKDLFSHIEGLGSMHRRRDVEEMFHELISTGMFERHVLNRSSISSFSRYFRHLIQNIEEKIREQIHLLRVQVHYVVTGDSRRTREDLAELQGLLFKAGPRSLNFFESCETAVPDGLELELGDVLPNSLEIPTEIDMTSFERNALGLSEQQAFAEFLKQAEEATVEQVLKKLQTAIDEQGQVLLSRYPISHGMIEYYVLSAISCFSEAIRSEEKGRTNLQWQTAERLVLLKNVVDYQYGFA